MRFHTERRTRRSLCRHGGDVYLAEVEPEPVRSFLAGTGPVTRFWQRKHDALLGLYRFAIARGYVTHAPLPNTVPKPAQAFVPYSYSHAERRRLLEAVTASCRHPGSLLDRLPFRTLVLLLYGAGLRSAKRWRLPWPTLISTPGSCRCVTARSTKPARCRSARIGSASSPST